MSHITPDRCAEFASGTGTGPLTLLGAAATDMRTFLQAGAVNGDTAWAFIQNVDVPTEWEIVRITYSPGGVTRSYVTGRSVVAGGLTSLFPFSAGTKSVTVVSPGFLGFREATGTPAISGGALALDWSAYSSFQINNNGNAAVSISGLDAGKGQTVSLLIKGDGTARTWTWPTVTFPDGVPTLTATSGRYDLITLTSFDGVNVFGLTVRQNMNLPF